MGDHDRHRPLMTSMEGELQLMEKSPSQTASSTIYRVPKTIREFDMNAYNPQVISIGPYHRNNPSVKAMEAYKWESLRAMLHRNRNISMEDYIRQIQSLEAQARRHYSEEINMESDDFVKMMVLDGCFIVEFLLNAKGNEETNEMRPICHTKWMMRVICQDMLLLENQLPFFVIQRLFNFYGSSSSLVPLALQFFEFFIPVNSNNLQSESVHHLLHLVYASLLPPTLSSTSIQVAGTNHPRQQPESDPSSSDLLPTLSSIPERVPGTDHPRLHSVRIPFATEMQRAGIEFKKKDNPDSLMDVTFQHDYAVIEIPRLFIQDFITNTLFRNAIAFELCHLESGTYFASYAFLMKCLLKSPKDVELLVEKRIIEHRLGNHKSVVVLFNSLSKGVVLDFKDFHLSSLFKDVATYSDRAGIKLRAFFYPCDRMLFLTFVGLYFALLQTMATILKARKNNVDA